MRDSTGGAPQRDEQPETPGERPDTPQLQPRERDMVGPVDPIDDTDGAEDTVTESSEESFPASDPPAWKRVN